MNTMIIICTKCDLEFQVDTAGILVKELFQKNKEVYRVWSADLLRCPECGIAIVSRFADKPIAEHWNKEKMQDILQQCETRTMGVDLFEWREYVQGEGNHPSKFLRRKSDQKVKTEIVTQGKPEDA